MCKLFQVFQAPLLFSVVLLSQMSRSNREAGWLKGGMKGLQEMGVQGLRQWREDTYTKRVYGRTRMDWAEFSKEKNRRLIWMLCRFAFMGEEETGNVDGSFFFFMETELERTAHMAIVLWIDLAVLWNTFSLKNVYLDQPKSNAIKFASFFKPDSSLSNTEDIRIFFLSKTTFYFNTCHSFF